MRGRCGSGTGRGIWQRAGRAGGVGRAEVGERGRVSGAGPCGRETGRWERKTGPTGNGQAGWARGGRWERARAGLERARGDWLEGPLAGAGYASRGCLPGGVKASGERRVRAGCASERGNGLTRGASVSEAGCARAGGGRPRRGPCRRGESGRWVGCWCAGGSGQARMRAACGVRRVCQVGSGAQRECDCWSEWLTSVLAAMLASGPGVAGGEGVRGR